MVPLTRRIADYLIRARFILATAWLATAVAGWWIAPQVELQRSLDRLFDSRDGELRSYQTALRIFGPREPILVAYEDPQTFDPQGAGLRRLRQLAEFLEGLDGVVETTSLVDLDELLDETFGMRIFDSGVIPTGLTDILEGLTHSSDHRAVAIVCLLDKEQSSESRRRTIAALRAWLQERPKDYRFVENRFGGAGVWEILVPLEGPLDWDRVQRIRRLENRLRTEVRIPVELSGGETSASDLPGLTQVLSVADALAGVVDIERLERIPLFNDFVITQGVEQFRQRLPGLLGSLLAENPDRPGEWYVRILLRSPQQLSSTAQQSIIAQVRAICANESAAWPIDRPPLVTGWYVLLARIVDHLLADQVATLSVATIAIVLLAWGATRRLSLALIAIVPNLLPIAVLLGALGWLGIPINMGVALIAAVSVGLSIDSTLHYLDIVRRRVRAGESWQQALFSAQHRAGAALCFATLALTAGFAAMVSSEFLPTVYFGALVCVAMLGGLLGNLLVLPLLLVWLDRKSSEAPSNSSYDSSRHFG